MSLPPCYHLPRWSLEGGNFKTKRFVVESDSETKSGAGDVCAIVALTFRILEGLRMCLSQTLGGRWCPCAGLAGESEPGLGHVTQVTSLLPVSLRIIPLTARGWSYMWPFQASDP